MAPWLAGFLLGLGVGVLGTIAISLFYVRRWMVTASIDAKMCEGLISRLAKADKQKHTCKGALDKVLKDNEELRTEKLRNWDIPEKL